MALTSADIKFYRSKTITDDNNNGGRMDETAEVVNATKYNLFPRVSFQERQNGVVRYRKLFIANRNNANEKAYNGLVALIGHSTGDDRFYILNGTQTDTQGDIISSTDWIGGGYLNSDVSAGATTIDVLFESNDYKIPAGSTIVLVDDVKTEWATVSNTTSATWNGNVATITLENGLANSFSASNTKIGICLSLGDLVPGVDGVNTSSSSGIFDATQIELNNVGTVYDIWTITFTSSTSFTVSGQFEGNQQNGDIANNYSAINPNTSTPFFTIPSSAWGGTWQAGDTVQFTTIPAAKAIWVKEVVPAGANREANNEVNLIWFVE